MVSHDQAVTAGYLEASRKLQYKRCNRRLILRNCTGPSVALIARCLQFGSPIFNSDKIHLTRIVPHGIAAAVYCLNGLSSFLISANNGNAGNSVKVKAPFAVTYSMQVRIITFLGNDIQKYRIEQILRCIRVIQSQLEICRSVIPGIIGPVGRGSRRIRAVLPFVSVLIPRCLLQQRNSRTGNIVYLRVRSQISVAFKTILTQNIFQHAVFGIILRQISRPCHNIRRCSCLTLKHRSHRVRIVDNSLLGAGYISSVLQLCCAGNVINNTIAYCAFQSKLHRLSRLQCTFQINDQYIVSFRIAKKLHPVNRKAIIGFHQRYFRREFRRGSCLHIHSPGKQIDENRISHAKDIGDVLQFQCIFQHIAGNNLLT